jgi:hypothetical protein
MAAAKERIPKTEDWLAERVGFELSGDFLNVVNTIKRHLDEVFSTGKRTPLDAIAETYWHLADQGPSGGSLKQKNLAAALLPKRITTGWETRSTPAATTEIGSCAKRPVECDLVP